jgi:hypothetical protein
MHSSEDVEIMTALLVFRSNLNAICKRKWSDLEAENKQLKTDLSTSAEENKKLNDDVAINRKKLFDCVRENMELKRENERLKSRRKQIIDLCADEVYRIPKLE